MKINISIWLSIFYAFSPSTSRTAVGSYSLHSFISHIKRGTVPSICLSTFTSVYSLLFEKKDDYNKNRPAVRACQKLSHDIYIDVNMQTCTWHTFL